MLNHFLLPLLCSLNFVRLTLNVLQPGSKEKDSSYWLLRNGAFCSYDGSACMYVLHNVVLTGTSEW